MGGAGLLAEATRGGLLPFGAGHALAKRGGTGKSDGKKGKGNKGQGKKKVTICHNGQTIRVASSALSRHLRHGDNVGACPTPDAPPAPPAPPAAGPGSCAHDGTSDGFYGPQRYAQTFLAPGTSITAAEIGLRYNPAGFSLTIEIRIVDEVGVPANTILARSSVYNIEATASGDPRMVSATFTTPATLTLGQTYALVVSGSTGFGIFSNISSNISVWTARCSPIVAQAATLSGLGSRRAETQTEAT